MRNKLSELGPISDQANPDDEFLFNKLGFKPGTFDVTPDGKVFYAPPYYYGDIFEYTKEGSTWKKTRVLQGYVTPKKGFVFA